MEPNNTRRIIYIILLVLLVLSVSTASQLKGISTVFTQLYYIPIALACIWWKRKGFIITAFLGTGLILLHIITGAGANHSIIEDLLRIAIMLVLSFLVSEVSLRESSLIGQCFLQNKGLKEKESELSEAKAKLEKQFREMEKFQRLMIGRELKMVELKKQMGKQTPEKE